MGVEAVEGREEAMEARRERREEEGGQGRLEGADMGLADVK